MLSRLLGSTFPVDREAGLPRWTIARKTRLGHSGKRWKLTDDVNVLALIKGEEHFIFVYDDASRPQLIDNFRDLAANPEVNLSWFDAMVLTTKAREQEQAEATPLAQESGVRDQESGVRDQVSECERRPRFSDS
jgi:hypothetical protein